MLKHFRTVAFVCLLAPALLTSCENKPETDPEPESNAGSVNIHFDSRRSLSEDFVVNKMYLNANNDSVSLNTFKYFISNITLIRENGSSYTEPNSYHLVTVGNTAEKEQFIIKNIPAGKYNKIRFNVGIDAANNN